MYENVLFCSALCILLLHYLGQAQLLRRGAYALRRCFHARRHPATDGDHGRDHGAPAAARSMPSNSLTPELQEEL
jgi:hypothetical protein